MTFSGKPTEWIRAQRSKNAVTLSGNGDGGLFKNDNSEIALVINSQFLKPPAGAFFEHLFHSRKPRGEFFCVKLQGHFEMRYGDRPGSSGMRIRREIPYGSPD